MSKFIDLHPMSLHEAIKLVSEHCLEGFKVRLNCGYPSYSFDMIDEYEDSARRFLIEDDPARAVLRALDVMYESI